MALTTTQVSELYVAIFNRASEMDGNAFWAAKSLTAAEIADAMLATSDATTYFGTSIDTNQAFIEHIYLNTLNKTYAQDTAGVDYWVGLLNAGATRGEVVAGLVTAAQDAANAGDAQDQFNNRVAVSDYTAATLATAPADYATSTSFSSGLTVTKDSATVTTAKASVDTIVTDNTAKTLSLTTGVDTLTGSKVNDTFTADVLTLGADTITDSSTTDSDTLNVMTNSSIANTTTITNVENINITSLGTTTVDMTNISGVKVFTTKDSTGGITVNNADSATMALGFSGATNNTVTVNYDAGTLSGITDNLSMSVSSAKNVTVDVDAGFETASLAISGTANTITSITAPGTSLTISGDGDATFAADALVGTSSVTVTNTAALKFGAISTTDVATFTATANTGGITGSTALVGTNIYSTDDIDGATTGLTMMLGSGNDNLKVTEAAAATKTNTIKLGAGNDILHLTNAGAGATYVFGEAGDDTIKVDSVALETTDLISGGEGTDTLVLTGNLVHNLVLLGVENINLDGTTGAKTTVSSSDTAVAFNVKVADNDEVDLAGLTAGSTVAVNALATTTGAAAAAKIQQVDIAFAQTEASSTIDFNTAVDLTNATTAITTSNITAVTLDFAEIVGAAAAGLLDVSAATSLTINSAKDIAFDDISAGTEKLQTITITAQDKVTFEEILNDQALTAITITAVDNIDMGAGAKFVEDADTLTTVSLTSSAGSVSIGEIGDNAGVTSDSDNLTSVILSGATTVTAGIIEADIIGDVTMTAANGLLTVAEITSAAAMGTVSLTSTLGGIKIDTGDIVAADTTGITVNATAKTYINVTGAAAGAKADVTNTDGDITSTLSGAAAATIDFTAGTINTTAKSGSVTLTASNTGGITTTVTNNEMVGNGLSTITLSALNASTVNSVTLLGYSAVTNVTGSIGADTVVNSAGGDALATDSTNSNDTYSLGSGTDTLSYATSTHGADSGTSAAGKITDGYAMNFTSSTITFDFTPVTGATNITTLAAGKVAQYDSTAVSSTSTTAGNIVAGGETDTVSGIEVIIGSAQNDYIAVANTGMTVAGGLGADKIVLNSGEDDVVMTSGLTIDTISSFTTGSDDIQLDLSEIETAGAGFAGITLDIIGGLGTSVAAGDTASILAIAGATTLTAANVLNYTAATAADAAALETALEAGGGLLSTGATGVTADDGMLIMYDNGTNIMLALVTFSATVAATTQIAAVDVADIATLSGITTDLVAGDFAFIA